MKKKSNIPIRIGIAVLFLIAISLIMTSTHSSTKATGQIFMEMYSKTPSAVLVDVRTPSEYTSGHIQGAINIDFENPSFTSHIATLDTTKTYFVYCRSGNRSGQAVSLMKAHGFTYIYDLQGGVSGNRDIPLQK